MEDVKKSSQNYSILQMKQKKYAAVNNIEWKVE